jgi:hypothetical protein
MFDTVNATPKDIVIIYILFMAACCLTYPIVSLIITSLEKGLAKWK